MKRQKGQEDPRSHQKYQKEDKFRRTGEYEDPMQENRKSLMRIKEVIRIFFVFATFYSLYTLRMSKYVRIKKTRGHYFIELSEHDYVPLC